MKNSRSSGLLASQPLLCLPTVGAGADVGAGAVYVM